MLQKGYHKRTGGKKMYKDYDTGYHTNHFIPIRIKISGISLCQDGSKQDL